MKLNLGCGQDYRKGWVNCDVLSSLTSDVHHDLNVYPYPFKNNTFDTILAQMILEHLDKPLACIKELIRISKSYAKITIIVPHARSLAQVTDIQHRTFFTQHSFDEELLEEYGFTELGLLSSRFIYVHGWKKYIPFKTFFNVFLNGIYDDMEFVFDVIK